MKNVSSVDLILFLAVKYNNDFNKIKNHLEKRKSFTQEEEEEMQGYAKKYDKFYCTLVNENYPKILKQAINPPFCIFDKSTYNALKSLEETMDL